VPMRLAAQLQPDELSVELRRGGQVACPNLQAGESCHSAESSTGSTPRTPLPLAVVERLR
jgi:hypothetical protein